MKLAVDTPIMDLLTGEQANFMGSPATLRRVIIYCGQVPGAPQGATEPPEDAAKAFELAMRAASAPKDGHMTLDVKEASFLKTRANSMTFPMMAGPLDMALEGASEGEPDES